MKNNNTSVTAYYQQIFTFLCGFHLLYSHLSFIDRRSFWFHYPRHFRRHTQHTIYNYLRYCNHNNNIYWSNIGLNHAILKYATNCHFFMDHLINSVAFPNDSPILLDVIKLEIFHLDFFQKFFPFFLIKKNKYNNPKLLK
jgi:hypothetical protein